ncbi:hypothetical protein PRIPAC_95299 [Pristionchus pacificus]|uniref:G protein-coupled receptor n=1 Tax=Pristionchus pacificus TaxID=54126 RepID=A0A2A6D1F2_PRIPA|nr:hypothetical protein PRIPAC_95299 [Pristionchus pacificus]|eukprot:PDM84210.1 G protein-coupled receptor [Pristionchus pacificus]
MVAHLDMAIAARVQLQVYLSFFRVMPVGDNWTIAKGVPHPLFGLWSVSWGTLCELLYIPCIYALYKEIGHSCYRIMLWLAIVDVIAILCNSICFGFFLIDGTVFCSRPWFVWIVGCVGLGMWCGACIGCLLLVTYRLFELLIIGRRFEAQTNLLILMATMYALYFAFLTPPILTNSEFNAMFYDPFIGDVPTEVKSKTSEVGRRKKLAVNGPVQIYIFN